MKHRWAALGAVLALVAVVPRDLFAQGSQQGGDRRGVEGGLRQNYPNPFNPETFIPFSVGPSQCDDHSKLYRVSVRIYNILTQPIAIPILQGGSGSVAGGQPLEKVQLSCGNYTAYWDGKDKRSGRPAASGIVLYELEINGRKTYKKGTIAK
jgi:hypothetical protein